MAPINNNTNTQNTILSERWDRARPGLVAFYENEAGLFLQPWNPHGAQRLDRRQQMAEPSSEHWKSVAMLHAINSPSTDTSNPMNLTFWTQNQYQTRKALIRAHTSTKAHSFLHLLMHSFIHSFMHPVRAPGL